MLTKIEVRNYRALRAISQTLEPYQVLIGPNASGKSTFLDVIAFLADIVSKPNLAEAIRTRAPDIRDLTWMHQSDWLEFAVEAEIPQTVQSDKQYRHVRYEVKAGVDPDTKELALLAETLWLLPDNYLNYLPTNSVPLVQQFYFPKAHDETRTLIHPRIKGARKTVDKQSAGNDYFRSEKTEWNNMFRLGPKRSALANLPEDDERFPAAVWFKRYIAEGVQRLVLNSEALRRPSPPQSARTFLPDGSNLPMVIHELAETAPQKLSEWIDHVRTALPDVKHISTREREEDRYRYLVLEYNTGLSAPSWTVSDGTLRLLALTILAYIPNLTGIYLIEEPENGIHPRAVETVLQSLQSVYDAQILLATHSPIILSQSRPEDLLCFARTPEGITDIVRGNLHPNLKDWQHQVDLGVLFGSGVLG